MYSIFYLLHYNNTWNNILFHVLFAKKICSLKSLFCTLLGGSFGRFVQKKLGTLNLWEDPYYLVKENVKAGISICEQWVTACSHLTGQVWQRYVPHPWKNEKYFPETLDKLGKRLEEVSSFGSLFLSVK